MTIIRETQKIWAEIRSLINVRTPESSRKISLNINEKVITDESSIPNHFNTSITKKIVNKIPKTNKTFDMYPSNLNTNSFFLTPIINENIESIISLFNLSKATSPNSIPVKILKDLKKELSEPLTKLINLFFSTGQFLGNLNLQKWSQFSKRDINKLATTADIFFFYRTLANLEKRIYQRLYLFFYENSLLFTYQFGFQNYHSTNQALTSITEKIRKALDEGKFACGVFLDFQKAFDTMDHDILLSKLEHYGVRGVPSEAT